MCDYKVCDAVVCIESQFPDDIGRLYVVDGFYPDGKSIMAREYIAPHGWNPANRCLLYGQFKHATDPVQLELVRQIIERGKAAMREFGIK